ncbi:hypothetical protein H0H87_012814 [Tephrocybe sp. NHM501043]|nr:hypothetical protein H0H87_012814 [Tephrocybe sp. NHM501043]
MFRAIERLNMAGGNNRAFTDSQVNARSIELDTTTTPELALPEEVHLPQLPRSWSRRPPLPSPSNATVLATNSRTLKDVEADWTAYVERRCKEWLILLPLTTAMLMGLVIVLLAVFLSAWRNGLSAIPPSIQHAESMSTASMVSGTIVTMMVLVDAAWIIWLIVKLRRFEGE